MNNLTWSQPNRVLIHVADAPAHGVMFHDPVMFDSQVIGALDKPGGQNVGKDSLPKDPLAKPPPASPGDPSGVAKPKDPDPDGNLMKGLLQKMKTLEIAYFFGKISPDTQIGSIHNRKKNSLNYRSFFNSFSIM